jgi:hypothetical protein
VFRADYEQSSYPSPEYVIFFACFRKFAVYLPLQRLPVVKYPFQCLPVFFVHENMISTFDIISSKKPHVAVSHISILVALKTSLIA